MTHFKVIYAVQVYDFLI